MELRGFISMCRTFEQNQVERVAKWKDEAEKLAKSLESKRCELARRELELKNIRGKLLKCESSKWIPEEDQSIQHAVQDLQLTIRSWAKDCSVKSFSDVLDTERLPEESSFLRRVSECSVYKEHSQFEGLEHPFLLLAAFLSEVIRVTVWGDPFFHFQNLNAEHAYSFAGGLNKTFYGMRDVDERKANSWRKDIIRHEFPDSASPLIRDSHAGELLVPKSVGEEVLQRVYSFLEDRFLTSIPQWMFKAGESEETQKMKEDLDQIFKRAGNLHFRLLTQQASFVWTSPAQQVGKRFSVRNDEFWIDQLHYLADRADESLNDRVVHIVVGTGLVAYGDAFGEDYSKRRVIVPARLFLERDARAIGHDPHTHQGTCSPEQSSRRSSIRLASGPKDKVPTSGTAGASSLPQDSQNVAVSEQSVAEADTCLSSLYSKGARLSLGEYCRDKKSSSRTRILEDSIGKAGWIDR
ncbi:hypothetical protein BC567DRAFT_268027 [Phyllosticta citribraziliensis]